MKLDQRLRDTSRLTMLALVSIVAGALLARVLANSPAPSLGTLTTAARAISL